MSQEHDDDHGRYLCDTCRDMMTDRLITVDGLEQAQCAVCAGEAVRLPDDKTPAVLWLPWPVVPRAAQKAILHRLAHGQWPDPTAAPESD